MDSILEKIKDKKLQEISNCLVLDNSDDIEEQFKSIENNFPKYDSDFLWLLCYPHRDSLLVKDYINKNYRKFHQYLDSGFPKKISRKGNFNSRMWEMLLCDILSSSGKLIKKSAGGGDFILELNNQSIQIEAICIDESKVESLRSIKPIYTKDNPVFTLEGNIDDLEKPVLLRALHGFDVKASNGQCHTDKPIIIAINSSNAVGLISRDDYVLRRMLFNLGNETISRTPGGDYIRGLQYSSLLSKKGGTFNLGRFLDKDYSHVSGVIYTSKKPIALIPGGYAWVNSGVFYVPNPNAKHKVDINFPFFKKMICNDDLYDVIEAEKSFV